MKTTITADALVRCARELAGTPWQHQGRGPAGIDCAGLPIVACRRAGLNLFDFAPLPRRYGRKATPDLLALIQAHCTPVSAPAPGVLVLFQFPGERYARHMGLLTATDLVIHAEAQTRRQVVEHGYRAHWVRWTHSLWWLPGVTHE